MSKAAARISRNLVAGFTFQKESHETSTCALQQD
jgi:hypothetical protein